MHGREPLLQRLVLPLRKPASAFSPRTRRVVSRSARHEIVQGRREPRRSLCVTARRFFSLTSSFCSSLSDLSLERCMSLGSAPVGKKKLFVKERESYRKRENERSSPEKREAALETGREGLKGKRDSNKRERERAPSKEARATQRTSREREGVCVSPLPRFASRGECSRAGASRRIFSACPRTTVAICVSFLNSYLWYVSASDLDDGEFQRTRARVS